MLPIRHAHILARANRHNVTTVSSAIACRLVLRRLLSTNDSLHPSHPSLHKSSSQRLHGTMEATDLNHVQLPYPNARPIQPLQPLVPLPSFEGPEDPALSTTLGDIELKHFMKDLYKRGWGVVRRDDPTNLMETVEAEHGPKVVRGVALEKDFWFRIEGRGAAEIDLNAGTVGLHGSLSVVQNMVELWEAFVQSEWIGHDSVRPWASAVARFLFLFLSPP